MEPFAQLFSGRSDAYGLYSEGEARQDGKKKGRGSTRSGPVTDELIADHLSGERRLGLIPIRRDGTVSWFAADIDEYKIDHQKVINDVQTHEIPVVLVKSKSNGLHLFCFVDGVILAETAINLMKNWSKKLGYSKCEIYPKQSRVEDDAIGNWIHIPYFNKDDPDSYAFGLNGEKLSIGQFIEISNAYKAKPDELIALLNSKEAAAGSSTELSKAPPCIEKMITEGIPEGGRNSALTHIGIYLLKSDQDNWRDRLGKLNYEIADPPLSLEELNGIVRNVAKSKYEYLCKIEPMCSICDKDTCKTRKWGVGPQQGMDYADIEIDRIIKILTDPPIYYVILDSRQVKMDTDEVLSPSRFRRRIYEATGKMIAVVKQHQHDLRIQLARVDEEDGPEEVSVDGQVIETFREWCETHIPRSPTIDQVIRGNPWYDIGNSEIVFRGQDLINAFKRLKKFNISENDVWAAIRNSGCTRRNIRIDNKQVKVWIFPVEEVWFDLPEEEKF